MLAAGVNVVCVIVPPSTHTCVNMGPIIPPSMVAVKPWVVVSLAVTVASAAFTGFMQ